MISMGGFMVIGEEISGGDGLKKGPWTSREDSILIEYVKKHGEGNWNAVQKNSGLLRCGKSCRLRWANHLRPNLKKGGFSPEEESIIIQLHAKLGNKWSRMAAQLPGRTDNEIKNYWNTRMKRRHRAGLPLYPRKTQDEATAFQLQLQRQHRKRHANSSPSCPSLFASTHSPETTNFTNPSFTDPPNQNFPLMTSSFVNKYFSEDDQNPTCHHFNFFSDSSTINMNNHNCGVGFKIPFPSSVSALYNQTYSVHNASLFQSYHSPHAQVEGDVNKGFSSFYSGMKTDFPLLQTPLHQITTPVSYDTSDYGLSHVFQKGNNGMLDDLLHESKVLSFNIKKSKEQINADVIAEKHRDALSYCQSKNGLMLSNEEMKGNMNLMDDNLVSLISHFPSSTIPLPGWYVKNLSNYSPSTTSSDVATIMKRPDQPKNIMKATNINLSMATTQDHDGLTIGSCYWKNLPGLC